MIDINELRRKLRSDDLIDHVDIHANVKPVLTEILDRLEEAESDAIEQARLNGVGASREAALMARLEAAEKEREELHTLVAVVKKQSWSEYALRVKKEKERDDLLARIEAMESDLRLIAETDPVDAALDPQRAVRIAVHSLYIAPGAQPAPSVPEGWKLVPIEPTPEMKTAGIGVEVYQASPPSTDSLTWEEAAAIYAAMISAAPESKP